MSKDAYNKIYKDQTRVVVYAKPETKAILAQAALDQGISLSELCNPKLEELADDIKSRTTQPVG